jgi:hypothetical protein
MSKLKPEETNSDSQKILAAFDRQRARHYLDEILMPLLRNAVKKEKAQDRSGNQQKEFLVRAVHGAFIEDQNGKRSVN